MTLSFEHPWLIPDWPVPTHVKAICTTRAGGMGSGPFASLNLGLHVGDVASTVHANRHHLKNVLWPAAFAGVGDDHLKAPPDWFFLQQVHGTQVLCLDADGVKQCASAGDLLEDALVADAAMTTQPGKVCVVMVADCLPVLLATKDGRAVAAAHAGWRGLAGVGCRADQSQGAVAAGVLEATVSRLRRGCLDPCPCDDIVAWLGPCIGPSVFEVGDEVRQSFVGYQADAQMFFRAGSRAGTWLADLAGLARLRLYALGVRQVFGNNSTPPWCTVSNPEMFFSYRRDQKVLGSTGRMAAAICLSGIGV